MADRTIQRIIFSANSILCLFSSFAQKDPTLMLREPMINGVRLLANHISLLLNMILNVDYRQPLCTSRDYIVNCSRCTWALICHRFMDQSVEMMEKMFAPVLAGVVHHVGARVVAE